MSHDIFFPEWECDRSRREDWLNIQWDRVIVSLC